MPSDMLTVQFEVEVFHERDFSGEPYIKDVYVHTLAPESVRKHVAQMAVAQWWREEAYRVSRPRTTETA